MKTRAQSFLIKFVLTMLCVCMVVLGFLTLSPKTFALANAENPAEVVEPAFTKNGVGMLTAPTGAVNASGKSTTVYYGGKPWYVLDTAYGVNGADDTTDTGVLLLSKYTFSRRTQWMAYYTDSHGASNGYLGSDIRGYLTGTSEQASGKGSAQNTFTVLRSVGYYGDTPTDINYGNYWSRSKANSYTEGKVYYVKDNNNFAISSTGFTFTEGNFNKAVTSNDLYIKVEQEADGVISYNGNFYLSATTWKDANTTYYYDITPYERVDVSAFENGTNYYTFSAPSSSWSSSTNNVRKAGLFAGYYVTSLDAASESPTRYNVAGEATGNRTLASDLGLTAADLQAVYKTTRSGEMDEDVFFLLSSSEAQNEAYGMSTQSSRKATYYGAQSTGSNWWLRTRYSNDATRYIETGGSLKYYNSNANAASIRPAFNLNPNQVLFTSAIEGGKAQFGDGFSALGNAETKNLKLTLKDSSIVAPTYSLLKKNVDGSYTIKYGNGIEGENSYVSAIIMDNGGNIYGYSKLGTTAEREARFTTPAGIELGETYKLYIFNEKCSSDVYGTDYASTLTECTVDTTATLNSISATFVNGYENGYTVFSKFEKSHIVVKATYSNGVTIDLSENDYDIEIPNYDSLKGFEYTKGATQTLTVKAKENEEKTVDINVVVIQKDISNAIITLGDALTYNGNEQTQTIESVTLDGIAVTYTVNGNTAKDVKIDGEYTLTITGKGNFTGTANKEWNIEKATYDMSGITFNDGEFTYSESANSIYINGQLPAGVSVDYTNNGQVNATTSPITVTAKFTGDGVNYNEIPDMTATITVNKANAVITVDTTPIVKTYGESFTLPVATTNFGTVVCDKKVSDLVNANTYTVTYTVAGTNNYNGDTKTVSVTINKATFDMSGITFVNKTVKYDGQAQSIEIGGTLPNGIKVEYVNNDKIEVGVYTITANFIYDTANYNAIQPMTATLTINKAEMVSNLVDENGKPIVIITSTNGFAPNVEILVKEISIDTAQTGNSVKENEKVAKIFDIILKANGNEIQPDESVTIKLLIPTELKDSEFRLVHNHEGTFTDIEYTVDGDYVVFTTDNFSEFLFVYDDTANLGWLIGLLAGIATLAIASGIILYVKLRKKQVKNNAGVK